MFNKVLCKECQDSGEYTTINVVNGKIQQITLPCKKCCPNEHRVIMDRLNIGVMKNFVNFLKG